MSAAEAQLKHVLAAGPVMPVYSPRAGDDAAGVARALHEGGVSAIEITLRDPAALDAVRAVVGACPEMMVGVGSVIDVAQLDLAGATGARFAVSPGSPESLLMASRGHALPLMPGVATASDIMRALEHGFRVLKLFPAESINGVGLLQSFAGPFAQVMFCPTGGITAESAPSYLDLSNVICVGASWLMPRHLVEDRNWAAISALADAAQRLPRRCSIDRR